MPIGELAYRSNCSLLILRVSQFYISKAGGFLSLQHHDKECRQESYSLGDKTNLNKINFIPLRNANFDFRSGINAKLYRFV